eukprot:gene39017-47465_t
MGGSYFSAFEQLLSLEKCRKHCREVFERWKIRSNKPDQSFEEVMYPHVSLSRPFTLEYIQIESLLKLLSSEIRSFPRFPISLELRRYSVFLNESGSTAFLCLLVAAETTKRLRGLVRAADTSLAAFGQKPFFAEPVFHVSIASVKVSYGNGEQEMQATEASLRDLCSMLNQQQLLGKRLRGGRCDATAVVEAEAEVDDASRALGLLVGCYGSDDEGEDEDEATVVTQAGKTYGDNAMICYAVDSERKDDAEDMVLFLEAVRVRIGDRVYASPLPSTVPSARRTVPNQFTRLSGLEQAV